MKNKKLLLSYCNYIQGFIIYAKNAVTLVSSLSLLCGLFLINFGKVRNVLILTNILIKWESTYEKPSEGHRFISHPLNPLTLFIINCMLRKACHYKIYNSFVTNFVKVTYTSMFSNCLQFHIFTEV